MKRTNETERRHVPLVEWIAGSLSLVVVLGTLSYLVFEAVQPAAPPSLSVHVLGIHRSAASFVVEVEIRNSARGAAAQVHLGGTGRSADGREATPQALIDYVPGFSSRRASLVFPFDPGQSAEVRIVGYSQP